MSNEIVKMKVEVVGHTEFEMPTGVEPWEPDELTVPHWGGQNLAEFAGRACYQSWSKPNPSTATNAGYLAHILDVNHQSVLEHGVASMYITGVSRSLTHELVRHRHFSYSQLSQRYVPAEEAGIVVPPELVSDDPANQQLLARAMEQAVENYKLIVLSMTAKLEAEGVTGTEAKKRARQAARCVLPNMTETRIVVTGNYRAWRHFFDMRAAQPADHEIRALAVECYRQLNDYAPNVLADFTVGTLADGTEYLSRESPSND